MAIPQRKIDRTSIYNDIVKMIEKSPDNEVEVSSTEFADRYGVQAPTMDYHLNKLVEEGHLTISKNRGRYNRKKYRLPKQATSKKAEVHTPFLNEESKSKFDKFLEEHKKNNPAAKKVVQEEKKETAPEKKSFPKMKLYPSPDYKKETEGDATERKINPNMKLIPAGSYTEEPTVEPEAVTSFEQELTLDDRIEQFLKNSSSVHDANVLLGHEDKEILSVVNETIQQNIVYLKDLSEQLSTVQSKQLIQHLIDDRNDMQKQMNRLEKERDEAYAMASKTKEKYEIDPSRVRFMQQVMTDTVDQFVKLPNHAMALGRQDFRNKITKETRDLVQYVLHIEK